MANCEEEQKAEAPRVLQNSKLFPEGVQTDGQFKEDLINAIIWKFLMSMSFVSLI